MLTISVDSHEVRAAIGRLADVSSHVARDLKPVLVKQVRATLAAAKAQTPRDEGTLLRSGSYEVGAQGPRALWAQVSFGGQASQYAQAQHETDSYTHTRAEWAAKYGYRVSSSLKTKREQVHAKRRMRILTAKVTTGGVITMRRKLTRKFRNVKGHKGGRAHFLHGKPWSAWNPQREAALTQAVATEAVRLCEAALSKGLGD